MQRLLKKAAAKARPLRREPRLGKLTGELRQEIEALSSVCLFLGPYRNLTTLTASVLFLHPQCQVLNHAGDRILGHPDLDFIAAYSDERFTNFCHFALVMSQGGRRGSYGGSITKAHAFADHAVMSRAYRARFGDSLMKRDVRSLVWKESMDTSNHLRDESVEVRTLLARQERLRFLMPIRNPIDCALSNKRTGMKRTLGDFGGDDVVGLVDRTVEEMAWFLRLAVDHPTRFFYYFQNDFGRDTAVRLASFLRVDPDERWIEDSLSVYDVSAGYEHSSELVDAYRSAVDAHLQGLPELQQRFLDML